jgi:hypothetical protein
MKNVLGGRAATDECVMSVTYDNGTHGTGSYPVPGGPGTGPGSASDNTRIMVLYG